MYKRASPSRISVIARGFSSHIQKILLSPKVNMTQVILNKEKALNALDLDMISSLRNELSNWSAKDDTKVVVMKGAGSKAFCAGGDVVSLLDARTSHSGEGKSSILDSFFRHEFMLDYGLATMKPIQVAIWNGIVMGGGVGISIHAPYKIATDSTIFAMPEGKIGFFTDVAGGFFLSRLQENIGLYLGLTSATIKGKDTVRAGVATHYIPQNNIVHFEEELTHEIEAYSGQDFRQVIDNVLLKYAEKVDGEFPNTSIISDTFDDNNVVGIIQNLRAEGSEFSMKTVDQIKANSPLSMRIIFEQIKRAKEIELREAFITDFRISQRFMEGHDFFEGVRCLLKEKGAKPSWEYKMMSKVPQEIIDSYFAPFSMEELELQI